MFELNETPKRILLSWIFDQISELGEFHSIYDAFSGNGLVGNYFKRKGYLVYTSDILQCNYWINRALIQNTPKDALGEEQIEKINVYIDSPEIIDFYGAWADQYFTENEVAWLGSWYYAMTQPEVEEAHRALGYVAVYATMSYWLSYNRHYLTDEKPLAPQDVLNHYLRYLSSLLWENGQENQVGYADAYEFVSKLQPPEWEYPPDLIYIYPPTPAGFRNYDLRFYLWECWTNQTTTLDLEALFPEDGTPKLGRFLDMESYKEALSLFLSLASGIPLWVISYNPKLIQKEELLELVSQYRPVHKETEFSISYPPSEDGGVHKEGLVFATVATSTDG